MKNKILIYDDNCPLCSWYSGLFVKCGLLDKEGRRSFSDLEPSLLNRIDFNKSRNEIPLLDTDSGKLLYGIDALLEILGSRMPWIKRAGSLRPVNWVLRKIYKLVSANRKLITGIRCSPGAIDCSPDMNYRYRFLFLLLCLVFNTVLLFPIHAIILKPVPGYTLSITELQSLHFGLVLVNCITTLAFRKQRAFEYIGQVNMLALISILLLCPLLLLASWFPFPSLIIAYLVLVTVIVFKEYIRRMDYAGILQQHQWIAGINLTTLLGFMLIVFA
jgi:predicted DCC family thiol-disulfide oxidoreductase YuxK